MKGLTEYLTEGNLTIDAKDLKIGHSEPKSEEQFQELADYGDLVYDAYVDNFGDKAPKTPWSTGMRQSPFERNLHKIVDTNHLDVHAFSFIKTYVFVRLTGKNGPEALEEARVMYEERMKSL